jgi:hypothetical protein
MDLLMEEKFVSFIGLSVLTGVALVYIIIAGVIAMVLMLRLNIQGKSSVHLVSTSYERSRIPTPDFDEIFDQAGGALQNNLESPAETPFNESFSTGDRIYDECGNSTATRKNTLPGAGNVYEQLVIQPEIKVTEVDVEPYLAPVQLKTQVEEDNLNTTCTIIIISNNTEEDEDNDINGIESYELNNNVYI